MGEWPHAILEIRLRYLQSTDRIALSATYQGTQLCYCDPDCYTSGQPVQISDRAGDAKGSWCNPGVRVMVLHNGESELAY